MTLDMSTLVRENPHAHAPNLNQRSEGVGLWEVEMVNYGLIFPEQTSYVSTFVVLLFCVDMLFCM